MPRPEILLTLSSSTGSSRGTVAGKHRSDRKVLPDPCVNLAVEPAGRLLYGVGSVRELEGRGIVVGTKFRAGGFSGFLPDR